MQKYVTILFALWLTVGSSCAVKAEVLGWLSNESQTTYVMHGEKSGKINLSEDQADSCAQIDKNPVISSLEFKGVNHNNLTSPVVFYIFSNALLLSFLFFSKRKKKKGCLRVTLDLYSPPLYLKFQRLQFYA